MANSIEELLAAIAEHDDCDYNKRVPSGLPQIDPSQVPGILASATRPVVLKFGKSFCGWTKRLNRVLAELAPRYQDRADFYEIDIPSHPEVREQWHLTTSPMMLLFKEGREVARTDAAEAHEVVPVFRQWFGEPAPKAEAAEKGS